MEDKTIGVLGGGSWATAIVKILSPNTSEQNKIHWYIRNDENVEYIKKFKHNPQYLSAVELETEKLFICSDIEQIVERSDVLIFAIPAAFLKSALDKIKQPLNDKLIVSAIKGIIPETHQIVGKYFIDRYNLPETSLAVVTGPCHAEEVALERLSYLTIVSTDLRNAEFLANKLDNRFIKTSISDDLYGTEYTAVLKNIMALAGGICQGLGYGDNFQAVLMSNAIIEIKRFINTVHPIKRDIKSSAYLGDLLVTGYSKFSRNRTLGNMIGKGYSVRSAILEMNMIAEGYYASKSIFEINKQYNINMPICDAVYRILYENKPPAFEIKLLTDKIR